MINEDQNQTLSASKEEMLKVFADFRAAKFYFPQEWEMPGSREHKPFLEAQPGHNHVQDTDEGIASDADRPMQRRYVSDAEILGLDRFGKTAAPTHQVYRKIQLCWFGIPVSNGHS